jgi:hypothetical protein
MLVPRHNSAGALAIRPQARAQQGLGLEHLGLERDEAIQVLGDDGDVLEVTDELHEMSPWVLVRERTTRMFTKSVKAFL